MRTLGIDVSHWEGRVDWASAGRVIGFAYYKCTDGIKFVDDQFENNHEGCRENGLAHAPYHFYQPTLDPDRQAEHFVEVAGKDYHRYIVDVEAPERMEGIVPRLRAFLVRMEQLTGSKPAIYTSAGYWNEFIHPKPSWVNEYDLVVAHYTGEHKPMLPPGWSTWRIWQFSDYWNMPGCSEEVDANWFNGNLEACRAWFGNGAEKSSQQNAANGLKMRSLFEHLHVRQAPRIDARVTGHLDKDEIVYVEQLGGNEVWVRHVQGWTAVERGGYRYMEVIK